MRTLSTFCIISLCTVLISSDVRGEEDNCAKLGELAGSVMSARQAGVPMSKIMAIARQDESISKLLTAIVIAAYEAPQFSVEENRQRRVASFKNEIMLECYKAAND